MPKMKSHRGARKRMKVTGTGKISMHAAYRRHLLSSKTSKQKRQLRRVLIVTGKLAKKLRSMISP